MSPKPIKKRKCIHIKDNGEPCGKNALKGRSKCKSHGGGGRPIESGLYSKLLKGRLQEKINHYKNDPKLTEMREYIATKKALLDELFETFLRTKKNKKKLNVATIENAIKILNGLTADVEKLHKMENGQKMTISVSVLSQAITVVVSIVDKNIADEKVKRRIFKEIGEFGFSIDGTKMPLN